MEQVPHFCCCAIPVYYDHSPSPSSLEYDSRFLPCPCSCALSLFPYLVSPIVKVSEMHPRTTPLQVASL